LKDNTFKFTLKEKILFLISIVFLFNGITLPIGIGVLIWILVKILNRTIWRDSKINTDFVN